MGTADFITAGSQRVVLLIDKTLQKLTPIERVPFHNGIFILRQFPRFEQHRIWDRNLPNIVHCSGINDRFHLFFTQPQFPVGHRQMAQKHLCNPTDPADVLPRFAVPEFHRCAERIDDEGIGTA